MILFRVVKEKFHFSIFRRAAKMLQPLHQRPRLTQRHPWPLVAFQHNPPGRVAAHGAHLPARPRCQSAHDAGEQVVTEPETAGPVTLCEQHGLPWPSEGQLALSLTRETGGMGHSLADEWYGYTFEGDTVYL